MSDVVTKTKKDSKIEAIQAEIAETRERLAGDLDELKDRVSPENMAQAAKEQVMDMAQDAKQAMKDGVMNAAHETKQKAIEIAGDVGSGVRRGFTGFGRSIRDNPVPAAIAAAGIGYLFYKAVMDRRDSFDERDTFNGQRYGEGYGEAYGIPRYGEARGADVSARRRLGSGQDGVELRIGDRDHSSGASDEGNGVMAGASHLAERAKESGQKAAEMARRGGRKAKRGAQAAFSSHPMIFGLGVFVAGLALGAMLPSTDREDELMGEQRDRFLREAKSRAQDVGDVAKEAARKAVAHVDQQLPSGTDRKVQGNGPSPGSGFG